MKKKKTYRLYEIPRNSKIVCDLSDESVYLIFCHLDGMYSYCETENGNIVHLSANAELTKKKNYYVFNTESSDTAITIQEGEKPKAKPTHIDVSVRLTFRVRASDEDTAIDTVEKLKLPKSYLDGSMDILEVDAKFNLVNSVRTL